MFGKLFIAFSRSEATQPDMERTGASFTNFTKGDAGSVLVRPEIDQRVAQEQARAYGMEAGAA